MKGFVVYSGHLAGVLLQQGFEMLHTRKDKKKPTKNVYIFRNTPEIEKTVNNYIQNKKVK